MKNNTAASTKRRANAALLNITAAKIPAKIKKVTIVPMSSAQGDKLGIGGAASTEKHKPIIYVPMDDSAMSRVMRLHESLHVRHTAKKVRGKWAEEVKQIVEDSWLHYPIWNISAISTNRDTLSVAWKEYRTASKRARAMMARKDIPGVLSSLLSIYRSRCMAKGVEKMLRTGKVRSPEYRAYYSASRLSHACNITLSESLQKLCDNDVEKKLLERAFQAMGNALNALYKLRYADPVTDRILHSKQKQIACRLLNWFVAPPEMPKQSDGKEKKGHSHKLGKCDIVEVTPRTAPKDSETSVLAMVANRSGPFINLGMITELRDCEFPFLQMEEEKLNGGTVIIDGSGSMHISQANLTKLMNILPGATVAVYNGDDEGCGTIWVVGRDGMLATDLSKVCRRQGNSVDLEAVQWLLEQDEPRVFVSDLGFCGSDDCPRKENQALALLANSLHSGEIAEHYEGFQEVFDSVEN